MILKYNIDGKDFYENWECDPNEIHICNSVKNFLDKLRLYSGTEQEYVYVNVYQLKVEDSQLVEKLIKSFQTDKPKMDFNTFVKIRQELLSKIPENKRDRCQSIAKQLSQYDPSSQYNTGSRRDYIVFLTQLVELVKQ